MTHNRKNKIRKLRKERGKRRIKTENKKSKTQNQNREKRRNWERKQKNRAVEGIRTRKKEEETAETEKGSKIRIIERRRSVKEKSALLSTLSTAAIRQFNNPFPNISSNNLILIKPNSSKHYKLDPCILWIAKMYQFCF